MLFMFSRRETIKPGNCEIEKCAQSANVFYRQKTGLRFFCPVEFARGPINSKFRLYIHTRNKTNLTRALF